MENAKDGNAGVAPTNNKHVIFSQQSPPITMRLTPSSDYAIVGVKNSMQALFQLETGEYQVESSKKKRDPLDICVVLDASGSMSGSKLENSKKAILEIIDNLCSDDSISVVTYGDHARIIFEKGDLSNKDKLRRQVSNISDDGCTNMEAGLKAARQLMAACKSDANRTRRVLLFSDGLVNRGTVRTQKGLCGMVSDLYQNQHAATTSFGIGDDFNEDLMTAIAEYGHGNYFFIESADQIQKFVGAVLGSILNRIGRDAKLMLRGANGTVVKQIYGFDNIQKGLFIGDIKQSNCKNILVEFDASPSASNLEVMNALEYEFSYVDHDGNAKTLTGSMKLELTKDSKKAEQQNEDVVVAVTVQKSANIDEEVEQLLEDGDVDMACQRKEMQYNMLRNIESERTGRVQYMMQKCVESNDIIRAEGASKKSKKKIKFNKRLQRCDSADWLKI